MTMHKTLEWHCLACQTVNSVGLFDSVNVSLHPDLRERVLCDEINSFVCDSCGDSHRFENRLLYHDMSKGFQVWYDCEYAVEGRERTSLRDRVVGIATHGPGYQRLVKITGTWEDFKAVILWEEARAATPCPSWKKAVEESPDQDSDNRDAGPVLQDLSHQEMEKRAESGCSEAQQHLANAYLCDEGTHRHVQKAAWWATQEPARRNRKERSLIVKLLETEEGCQSLHERWEALAKESDLQSIYELGYSHYRGRYYDESMERAAVLFSEAAEGGVSLAQFYLGAIRDFGLSGKPDKALASSLYQQSAAGGNPFAAFNLGYMLMSEGGGSTALKNALFWCVASCGIADDNGMSTQIREQMSETDVEEAKGRAAGWLIELAAQEAKPDFWYEEAKLSNNFMRHDAPE